ncbi:MAG: type II toxin-antitoxin system prevent-host-death family antitoxin [Candidatus Omnitrophica bacterium]|nr:type II toxin-antitoxin system prevent-host-death family antitoxin [Candidatus Omnitrophota bacterium]
METSIKQLRMELKEILDLVSQGKTVTVTKHGKPYAKIVPVTDGVPAVSHESLYNLWKDRDDIQDPTQYVHDQRRRDRSR